MAEQLTSWMDPEAKWPYHPVADLFPPLGHWEFEGPIADSAKNGLILRIWLHPDGSILDGRSRHRGFTGFCTVIHGGPWDNYYHWLVDNLPRLFALHHPRLQQIPDIVQLLCQALSEQETAALEALLPTNVRIKRVPNNVKARVERYVSPLI